MATYTPTLLAARTLARAEAINAQLQAIAAIINQQADTTEVNEGRQNFVVGGGVADAYTATMDPAPAAYVAGLSIRIQWPVANTGPSTLNVNGLGLRAIKAPLGVDPVAGELAAGSIADVVYDGTAFHIIHSSVLAPGAQVSPTDATAGRLLKVGAFGLGAENLETLSAAGSISNLAVNGRWRILGADAVAAGGPSSNAGIVDHIQYASGFKAQTYYEVNGTYLRWMRHWIPGSSAWSAWRQEGTVLDLLGFAEGAGGSVTQPTSKGTSITLNKPCGKITTHSSAIAGGSSSGFILSNSYIDADDTVTVHVHGTAGYRIDVAYTNPGVVSIRINNITGGSLSDALVLNFAVIKGVSS